MSRPSPPDRYRFGEFVISVSRRQLLAMFEAELFGIGLAAGLTRRIQLRGPS